MPSKSQRALFINTLKSSSDMLLTSAYSIEKLRKIKSEHEKWVMKKLSEEEGRKIQEVKLERIKENTPEHLVRIEIIEGFCDKRKQTISIRGEIKMKVRLKIVIMPLIFGCISSIILMSFELRYFFSDIDYDQISLGLMFLLLSQSIFFTIVFLAVTLTLKYIKKGFRKGNHLNNTGLALQIISIFLVLTVFYIPSLIYLFFAISFTLLCIGLISYHQTNHDLSMSFILWGIAILILLYLLTSVGYWS